MTIGGWKIILWGQYPLWSSTLETSFTKLAYEVQKESTGVLKYYETEAYKVKDGKIKLGKGNGGSRGDFY